MKCPTTLITGTRKGIGKYLAQYYLSNGHHVVGCSRNDADWSQDGYEHFATDVSNEENVKKIFKHLRKKYGCLHHLINNAGVAAMNHSLLTPMATVRKMLSTNVAGTFLFCREAAKLMQKNKFGRIINLSSVAVPLKLEGESIYAASKAAIVSLTAVLSKELAEFGITVNAIGPTPIQTDLIQGVPAEKLNELIGRQAIKRFGNFNDISNVIDFYIKPESDYITGQVINLGGV